jgi:hypothetical protein
MPAIRAETGRETPWRRKPKVIAPSRGRKYTPRPFLKPISETDVKNASVFLDLKEKRKKESVKLWVKWTSGPLDLWTSGPLDLWTSGPLDLWKIINVLSYLSRAFCMI